MLISPVVLRPFIQKTAANAASHQASSLSNLLDKFRYSNPLSIHALREFHHESASVIDSVRRKMSHEGAAARDSSNARLSPPLFELPENMNDYEVWTVRLPASLNVDSLQGVELDVSETATFQTEDDEQQLRMTRGEAFENEQFRLLIRDNDDNDFLVPHNRPFDRHYNISVNHGDSSRGSAGAKTGNGAGTDGYVSTILFSHSSSVGIETTMDATRRRQCCK